VRRWALVRARARLLVGRLWLRRGGLDRAEAEFVKALGLIGGAGHPLEEAALEELSGLYLSSELLGRARSALERLLEFKEGSGQKEVYSLGVIEDLGGVCYSSGAYEDAALMFERAVNLRLGFQGADGPDVALARIDLAGAYEVLGRFEEAEQLYLKSLSALEEEDPPGPNLARALNDLGWLYFRQDRSKEALDPYRRSIDIKASVFGEGHFEWAITVGNLAIALDALGRFREAYPYHKQALAAKEEALGPADLSVAVTLDNFAGHYMDQEKFDLAIPLLERAVSIQDARLGEDHVELAVPLNNLAYAKARLDEFDEAEALHERALSIMEEALGPGDPEVAGALRNLGLYHDRMGKDGLGRFSRRPSVRAMARWRKRWRAWRVSTTRVRGSAKRLFCRRGRWRFSRRRLILTTRFWRHRSATWRFCTRRSAITLRRPPATPGRWRSTASRFRPTIPRWRAP